MRNVHSYLSRLKLKHLVAGLVLWLLILLAVYLLMTYQTGLRNDDTRQRGIAVTQELSNQIRLPLLEKDIPGVQALLRQAHKKTDAIYASVSDHGGQIIAYTGAENFIPRSQDRRTSPVKDDVAYLEGLLKSHQKVFRFTADVFFSGTRIGEVVMALSAHDSDHLRSGFQIAAVIGGLLFFCCCCWCVSAFGPAYQANWGHGRRRAARPVKPPHETYPRSFARCAEPISRFRGMLFVEPNSIDW